MANRIIAAYRTQEKKGVVKTRSDMTSDDSELNSYDEFTPILEAPESYEIDQQQVYTGGIFRTSYGGSRVQMIADPRTGFNAFEVFDGEELVAQFAEGQLSFINPLTGDGAGILLVGDDLEIAVTNGNILLNPTSLGSGGYVESSGDIRPSVDLGYDLGDSSAYWNRVYAASIQFRAANVVSLNQGQMAYHDNAGTQQFRGNAGGFFGSFDLTGV
jgi:hypothetical protein